MLLKVVGTIQGEKIIAILLLEAYFNFENKLYFVSCIMQRYEESVILPKEQHGGRSGHTLIAVSILRPLFLTIHNKQVGMEY